MGVVKNSKYGDLREEPVPIVYLPVSQQQTPNPFQQVVIHSALPLPVVTSRIKLALAKRARRSALTSEFSKHKSRNPFFPKD